MKLRNGPLLKPQPEFSLLPQPVTLKDGTEATFIPVYEPSQLSPQLLQALHKEFTKEIEKGDTYPHFHTLSYEEFVNYWFHSFVCVLSAGDNLLGSFYIKPNYPERCSHVCNAGFLVESESRGQGIGRLLAKQYLKWAPQLGYTYSVFNLVFVTNQASQRLWESFGFDRIGYLPGVASLKGHEKPVDAIMYGKKLV